MPFWLGLGARFRCEVLKRGGVYDGWLLIFEVGCVLQRKQQENQTPRIRAALSPSSNPIRLRNVHERGRRVRGFRVTKERAVPLNQQMYQL